MRRPYLLITLAWLLNASAWFLPTVGPGVTLLRPWPLAIDGFGAFVMALRAIMPAPFRDFWEGALSLLAILSVLTSLLFVIGSGWVILRGTWAIRRFSAWAAAVAFALNAHWNGWELGLGIGYYSWWFSFAVLSAGLFDLTGRKGTAELMPTQAAPLPG